MWKDIIKISEKPIFQGYYSDSHKASDKVKSLFKKTREEYGGQVPLSFMLYVSKNKGDKRRISEQAIEESLVSFRIDADNFQDYTMKLSKLSSDASPAIKSFEEIKITYVGGA